MKTSCGNNLPSKTAKSLIPLSVLVITIVIGLGAYSNIGFFKSLDLFFYDRFMKTFVSGQASDKITIIDIDETSLSAVGQWPWPRYRLAQLVNTLHEMQPGAMGLDILLPEPDRTSLKNIQTQFKTDFDLNLEFKGIPSSLTDNDGYLAHVFKKSHIVGAKYFYFDHFNRKIACRDNSFKVTDPSGLLTLNKATGVLCNTAPVETALGSSGFINNQHDDDGLIRQTPLLIEFQGEIFPHLSLSVFMKANGITQAQVLKNRYGIYINAGRYHIPITKNGSIQMQFTGPGKSHKFISAVDILNNKVSLSDIQGKIVLIGSSAIGLNDIHHTIYDPYFPGVEVHGVIIDNIYNGHQIIRPIWSRHFIFGVCLATGILSAFLLFSSSGPATLFFGTVAWICVLVVSSALFYMRRFIFISPGLPILIAVFHFSFYSYVRFAISRRASFLWFKRLVKSQQLTMEAMVSMVETRDPETGEHIKRTQHYAQALARYLKKNGLFLSMLTDTYIATLFLSVPLHDIGKVGIPDRILLKPGKLTDEEFGLMKQHTSHGRETIERVSKDIKGDHYLKMGAEIAGTHHERWDGKGYPQGLSGDDIPLSGRIMTLADVYDALISRRCYKPSFSHETAMDIIRQGKGTLFDPVIVDAFFAIESEIKAIALKFKDGIEKAPEGIKDIFTITQGAHKCLTESSMPEKD